MSDLNAGVVRRFLRALALTPVLLVPALSAPAFATPPEGWPQAEEVGALNFLMVLVVIPLGLALVIAVLTYVPSMVRGEKYTPGRAWRNENEWFGGPTEGLQAADEVDPQQARTSSDRGGASARW